MNRLSLLALAASAVAISPQAFAYDTQLDSETVREAYFLGRRSDQQTAGFLGGYFKQLPMPERGAYISQIALYTPYSQVVMNSWRHTLGYSAQQAEQDYQIAGDVIKIRVQIEFTPTFPAVRKVVPTHERSRTVGYVYRAGDFWRDFQFSLIQSDEPVKPLFVKGAPIYDDNGFDGAEVWLEFDARDVKSEEAIVEIASPEGGLAAAKFDLSRLR